MSKQSSKRTTKAPASALAHPLRIRILEVLNERDLSPTQFVEERLASGLDVSAEGLSQISYHFRALAEAGCLEVVRLIPVRGSMEHLYRGTARAHYVEEEWKELPLTEREKASRTALLSFMARAESAILHGTFDNRIDRHQSWLAMDLDEQGWAELTNLLNEALDTVSQIRDEALDRLAADPDLQSFRATFGALGFESPPVTRPEPND